MMKRFVAGILTLTLCAAVSATAKHSRPKILGIESVTFYSTSLPAARNFYARIADPKLTCRMCEQEALQPFTVSLPSGQSVHFLSAKGTPPPNLLVEVVLATDNVKVMREYLAANKVAFDKPDKPKDAKDASFSVTDPDGHRIGFVQVAADWSPSNTDALRLIHAGFVVNDRPAEDHFYKDILGFHLYWHGGMKDDVDNWVAMQVPDGTDWIEYMLNVSPTASKHTLGVMNHIALGVTDIHATQQRVIANGAKPTEEPKVGRDGKWQLNLYDPDETRTEFMEFTPKEKPCCSEFTGTHPGPK
jgi:catechol 2,3-dioxygenase-like lactoylglutathione lyase family enzyme